MDGFAVAQAATRMRKELKGNHLVGTRE
jgi:hypothetical protein